MRKRALLLAFCLILLNCSSFAHNLKNKQSFWKEFAEVSKIYRPSKGEQKITEYILRKAKLKSCKSFVDEFGNISVEIPATKGQESLPAIILQSHLDMVCVAKKHSEFVWGKDFIETRVKDGWLCATKTSLGADNGIGVAAMLDVLNSPPKSHGPIQLLFTTDEEGDFSGVCALKPEQFKGNYLLNLDSEEAGEFNVGCAGGQADEVKIPLCFEKISPSEKVFEISISGGLGGHSGVDIHRERANALSELFKLLYRVNKVIPIKLVNFSGGTSDTAIPSEAKAIFVCRETDKNRLIERLNFSFTILKYRFSKTDKNLIPKIKAIKRKIVRSISKECSDRIIKCFSDIPSGILVMSKSWPGNVQTSLNPGLLKIDGNSAYLKIHIQGTSISCISKVSERIDRIATVCKATHIAGFPYRPWEADRNSDLIKESVKIHQKILGTLPKLKVVHAGIECGEIKHIFPSIQMISFGPDIRNAHTANEKVKIDTVENFLNLLRAMVTGLPKALNHKLN